MDVEIGKTGGSETPASVMSEYVAEHVTALMTLGGIESISATKYASGFGSRLHVTMVPFSFAPSRVKEQGIVIKDAIATILSVANITKVVMKPSEDDLEEMKATWEKAVKDAKDANGGSAQDFSGLSSYDSSVTKGDVEHTDRT